MVNYFFDQSRCSKEKKKSCVTNKKKSKTVVNPIKCIFVTYLVINLCKKFRKKRTIVDNRTIYHTDLSGK